VIWDRGQALCHHSGAGGGGRLASNAQEADGQSWRVRGTESGHVTRIHSLQENVSEEADTGQC
jgi:hypothetical protein